MTHRNKILIVASIVAVMFTTVECKHKPRSYEPANSMGIEDIAFIAQDTTHYRALIFTSPYCFGCRQENGAMQKVVDAMDTSLWHVYYLIVEDIVDSAHWEEVVEDMMDMGIPRELIYHCRLPFEKGMYNDVVRLFRTAQPIDSRSRLEGVPFVIVADTNNYIPVLRYKPAPDSDSSWFGVRGYLDEEYLRDNSDFTFDDGCFSVAVTDTPTTDD